MDGVWLEAGIFAFTPGPLLAIGTPAIITRLDQVCFPRGSFVKLSHHRNSRPLQGHHPRVLPPLPITLYLWLPPCHSIWCQAVSPSESTPVSFSRPRRANQYRRTRRRHRARTGQAPNKELVLRTNWSLAVVSINDGSFSDFLISRLHH